MIPVVCTHTIPPGPLRFWFAEHGLELDDVQEATVRIGYPEPNGHPAWLDVVWMKRNQRGERYADETGERVATGTASIPLRSWPPLLPVPTSSGPIAPTGQGRFAGFTVRDCGEDCAKCADARAES